MELVKGSCTNGQLLTCVYPWWHQHHCQISRASGSCRRGDDERDDRNIQWQSDVEVSLSCPICMPGIEECRNDSKDVWRGGEEKGLYPPVFQGLDDCWEEVRDGRRRDDAK